MIDVRFFLVLLGWIILVIGFYFRDYPITTMSSMWLMVLGVYLVRFGLPDVNFTFLTMGLGLVHIGIGGYVFLRGTWEQYHDKF